jgi:subtilisin family serine protease
VDIYTIDTGVLTTHEDFGGRAQQGPAFGYPNVRDSRYLSGVIESLKYTGVGIISQTTETVTEAMWRALLWGRNSAWRRHVRTIVSVASATLLTFTYLQKANLIALKCLGDEGGGRISDIIGKLPTTPTTSGRGGGN